MGTVEAAVAHCVASIARGSALRPKTVIGVFLLLSLALTAGLVAAEVEFRGRELWTDPNAQVSLDLDFVDAVFTPIERFNLVLYTPAAGASNVLTYETMEEAFALHEEVLAIRTASGLGFEDLCQLNFAGTCDLGGPLRFWGFNHSTFLAQESSTATVRATCLADQYPDLEKVPREADFGSFRVAGDGLASSGGMVLNYRLVRILEGATSVAEEDEEQLDFEEQFIDVVLARKETAAATVQIDVISERSVDDELEEAIGGDIALLIIAFVTMAVFTSVTLGKGCDALRGRALLATSDIFVIIFSAGGAYGFCSVVGVPFTSLAQILPFILVGIGADNMFVIVGAFDRTDKRDKVEQRMYNSMYDAGTSITVTSLTDMAAFYLTSLNKLPALIWFGQYAGTAVLFIFIAHLTVFPAMLALDEHRILAGRRDIVPCCCSAALPSDSESAKGKGAQAEYSSRLATFFRDRYAPLLLRPAVKAMVIVGFTALTAVLAWQATTIDTEFFLREIAPDDSYVQSTFDVLDELYGEGAASNSQPVGLYFKAANYGDFGVQTEMQRLAVAVLAADAIDASQGVQDWHATFSQWVVLEPAFAASLDGTGTFLVGSPQFFAGAVQTWLLEPEFAPFEPAIAFSGAGASAIIKASRIGFFLRTTNSAEEDVDALEELEAIAAGSFLGADVFINAFNFVFTDQKRIIVGQTLSTVGFAIGAVAVISAVLLHPISSVICIVALTMTFTCLLGSLPLLSLSLNSVSGINLILSIGLIVDAQVHVLRAYGVVDLVLSRDARVASTLHKIGPAVLLGLLTTLLGIAPVAAASSVVFRTFFKIFVAIVVLSGAFGLVFVPVVLSLVGPDITRPAPASSRASESSLERPEPQSVVVT